MTPDAALDHIAAIPTVNGRIQAISSLSDAEWEALTEHRRLHDRLRSGVITVQLEEG